MIKEAINRILDLAVPPVIKAENGLQYSTVGLNLVKAPMPQTIQVRTLTGLVDYVRANRDNLDFRFMICQVVNHGSVRVYSALHSEYQDRSFIITADYSGPDNLRFGQFLKQDEFSIMLQSGFVEYPENETLKATDRGLVLQYSSAVKEVNEDTYVDDGITQAVTVRMGIAKVEKVAMPNPVTLRPYRTFIEVEQPASSFVFRAESGPRFALYEADGGAWKSEAMRSVKSYLEYELADTGLQIIA